MIRILAVLFFWAGLACADTYFFQLNRFGGIEINTHGEDGEVRFFQGNKQRTETTFESRIKVKNFATPEGLHFRIDKLDKPVIHDPARNINSGNYRLHITGDGPAFNSMQARLPRLADFAESGEFLTFYGEKTE